MPYLPADVYYGGGGGGLMKIIIVIVGPIPTCEGGGGRGGLNIVGKRNILEIGRDRM